MFDRFIRALALVMIIFIFSGCQDNRAVTMATVGEEASIREAVTVADPQAAVTAIYASLEEHSAVPLSGWQLAEDLGIEESDVEEYYGRISTAEGGLADVIFLLPAENKRESVSLALSAYKERRITEFENYDILDAYSIAQNAVIYEQGDYVILLMLKDNDAARAIVDEYIPL